MKRIAAAMLMALATGLPAGAQSLAEARAAYLAAWEAAPLALRKAVFVTGPAEGYGLAAERGSNRYKPDMPIHIYLEPVGYGWIEDAGMLRFGVSVGLRILDPGAQELFAQEDFLKLAARSSERATEFFGNVTLNLSGLPRGDFTLELTLTDLASPESVSVEMPITVE